MTIEIKFLNQVLRFAAAAALLYCIAAGFYIKRVSYEATWILYVGNFLFAAAIGVFIAWFYKQHQKDVGTIRLVVVGAKAAVAGIVMAAIACVVLLLILEPAAFKSASATDVALQHSPGQFEGKNQGFGVILFTNVFLGNAGASFFISLLIPFAVMKNLYADQKEKPLSSNTPASNENPKKNYHI